MKIFYALELCTYLALLPIAYKVISGIDIGKIFKKGHIIEIRLFYLFLTIIIAKITGDLINMIMNYVRLLFS